MTNDCAILPLPGPNLCDKEFLISPHCSSLSPLNLNQLSMSTALAWNHLSHRQVCPEIYLELIRDNLRCLLKQQQSQLDLVTRFLSLRNFFFFFFLTRCWKTFIRELTKAKPAAGFQQTAINKFWLTDSWLLLSLPFSLLKRRKHLLCKNHLPKLSPSWDCLLLCHQVPSPKPLEG